MNTADGIRPADGGGGGGGVPSVFGRTGPITAETGDYSVDQVTGAAPLESPEFTGTPTGQTATPASTSTTQLATCAFVQGAVAAGILPPVTFKAGTGPTVSGTGLIGWPAATTGIASLAAGTYDVDWGAVFTCTATGGVPGIAVQIGAVTVPSGTIDGHASPSNGSRQSIPARGTYIHPGGPLSISTSVRRASGTGNVIPQELTFTMRRTA